MYINPVSFRNDVHIQAEWIPHSIYEGVNDTFMSIKAHITFIEIFFHKNFTVDTNTRLSNTKVTNNILCIICDRNYIINCYISAFICFS